MGSRGAVSGKAGAGGRANNYYYDTDDKQIYIKEILRQSQFQKPLVNLTKSNLNTMKMMTK